jgi:hypothetical protein
MSTVTIEFTEKPSLPCPTWRPKIFNVIEEFAKQHAAFCSKDGISGQYLLDLKRGDFLIGFITKLNQPRDDGQVVYTMSIFERGDNAINFWCNQPVADELQFVQDLTSFLRSGVKFHHHNEKAVNQLLLRIAEREDNDNWW